MPTVLGIVASARRLGNSEIMVKEIFGRIETPCRLELLRLTDFRIESCRGCYTCLFLEGGCPIDDDCTDVREAIAAADAVIVAAPAYFLGAHHALKRFLDRGLSFYGDLDRLWGKPAVGVAIAGIPGMEGATLLGVERFLKLILADVRATRVVYGALPGEIFLDEANRETARQLAASLFGTPETKSGPRCSLCGSDTFRLMAEGRVRCMLCSNPGSLATDDGQTVVTMQPTDHQIFLTRQDVIDHHAWLVGMKERFMSMRKTLKPITLQYRQVGQWIQPREKTETINGTKDGQP